MNSFLKVFFICLVFSNHLNAQSSNDVMAFYEEENLGKKTVIANRLWDQLHQSGIDTLRQIAIELIVLGNEQKNDPAIFVGKRAMGSSLIRSGEVKKGITYLKDALTYFREKENRTIETEILSEIGNGYLNDGQPIKAESYYLQSLKVGKESDDPTAKFMAELNLAQVYIQMKNFDKASAFLKHYKKEALKRGKLESVGAAYALLGQIEEERKNYPLATEYFRKSADFGKRSNSKNQIAHALNNLAIVYYRKNLADSSLLLFEQALELRKQVGNARFVAESYFNIGGLYFELAKYDKAEEYYKISLDYAKQKKLKREEMDAVEALIELYKKQGKEKLALDFSTKMIDLQRLYNQQQAETNANNADELEVIDQLDQDRKKKESETRFLRLQKESTTKWNYVYLSGALLTLALIAIILYRKLKKKEVA